MKTTITILIPEKYTPEFQVELARKIRGILPNDCFFTGEHSEKYPEPNRLIGEDESIQRCW